MTDKTAKSQSHLSRIFKQWSRNRRAVAGVLEALRHEEFAGVEAVTRGAGDDDRLQAVAERITAGHQRRARGRAHGLDVELRELRAAGGKPVNVGRLDVGAAVEADILPAEIVGDDVDDVVLFPGC